jgi:hypothetical protein
LGNLPYKCDEGGSKTLVYSIDRSQLSKTTRVGLSDPAISFSAIKTASLIFDAKIYMFYRGIKRLYANKEIKPFRYLSPPLDFGEAHFTNLKKYIMNETKDIWKKPEWNSSLYYSLEDSTSDIVGSALGWTNV